MTDMIETDLCVIGAGSGGLSVAAGAAQLGARVVLIEQSKMGGDCLNTGCVPSKSLIAAAHAAHAVRTSGRFGVNGHEPEIDFLMVRRHVRDVVAEIAPNDSVERFEGLGVTVLRAHARFIAQGEIEAGSNARARPPLRSGNRLLPLCATDSGAHGYAPPDERVDLRTR
jgi:pyruvate/2-oxoglutarate dehydrogenase complex dihydrolipoamide dehydrogenase (E3) component